jgi:ABC-type amino acid transport system permease subunit
VNVIRGTPVFLQIYIAFFGLPLAGIHIPSFVMGVIVLAMNSAAYQCEIFRAGIQSIPVGQTEAATVLGYTKVQTFLKIIFPQMVKRTIPPVTNEVITLVKDTSLAFVLAYQEMFTYAKQVSAAMSSLMPLFVAGVFYYVFNLVVTLIMNYIEKRLNYYN